MEDRLEICLEPHGHFQVEPGIEDRVLNTSLMGSLLEQVKAANKPPNISQSLSAGASGVIVNQGMKTSAIPFTGHGHSLASTSSVDTRRPGDLIMGSGHGKRKARRASDSGVRHEESISEDGEDEEEAVMETGEEAATGGKEEDVPLRRLGPGFSVLDQNAANQFSQTTDALRRLASQIDAIVENEEGREEEVVFVPQEVKVRCHLEMTGYS